MLAGALLGTAFLAPALGILAWVALVPLLAALDARLRAGDGARRLFGLGWLFGLAFYLIGMHWVARLSAVAITVPWLRVPAWLAAGAYLALYPALALALTGWMVRRAGAPLALAFPPAWMACEVLRGSGELGFPWFQPGYTQHALAPVLQMASVGGVMLVTLWVLAVNVLLWRLWQARREPGGGRIARAAALALTVLLPLAWGSAVLRAAPRARGPALALVQTDIPGEEKWSGTHQKEILQRCVSLSEQASRLNPRPVLIVWPETATGSYLRRQLDQALEVTELAARTGIPIFTGYADYDFDSLGVVRNYNAAGLFLPDAARSARYAKRHLVPFGERIPFQWLVPQLGRIDLGQAEWTPGRAPVLFPSAAGPFGCLICFESIYPDLARDDVRRGARWLVNITNDEWFGMSAALPQHAAMAAFRAAENHVPLARCANTGLTVFYDAYGRVEGRLPAFQPGILHGTLATPGPATLYTRLGDWPSMLACAAILLLLARGLARRGRAS